MLEIAISPCPNDTFLFAPWLTGALGPPPTAHFADVETLNNWALEGRFPLIKISCALRPPGYTLLPVGMALGFGVGPKIIASSPFPIEELAHKRVALPGKHTTAHALFHRFAPQPKEICFCPFDQIFTLLKKGEVDAGVIIHESRFTFHAAGFAEIADLGTLWESATHLPLPLGGLALCDTFPNRSALIDTIQASFDHAHAHKERYLPFVQEHAQEIEKSVIEKHIATYVNEETRALSSRGQKALKALQDEAYRFCDIS